MDAVVMRGLPGQPSHDPTKPWGFGQQAPLKPEYAKVLEDSIADQAKGGLGNFPTAWCLPAGMPHMMMAFGPQEVHRHPRYHLHRHRLGRSSAAHLHRRPRLASGYRADLCRLRDWKVGRPGRRRPLRRARSRDPGFKGPRAFDPAGLPLAFDNQSIFKERFYLDKDDQNLLHDEMTVIDNALTRPWTVDKKYVRNPNPAQTGRNIIAAEETRRS